MGRHIVHTDRRGNASNTRVAIIKTNIATELIEVLGTSSRGRSTVGYRRIGIVIVADGLVVRGRVCPERHAGVTVITFIVGHHQVAGSVVRERLIQRKGVPSGNKRMHTRNDSNLCQRGGIYVVRVVVKGGLCRVGQPDSDVTRSVVVGRQGGAVEADCRDGAGRDVQFGSVINLLRISIVVQTIERQIAVGYGSSSYSLVSLAQTWGVEGFSVGGTLCAITNHCNRDLIGCSRSQACQQIGKLGNWGLREKRVVQIDVVTARSGKL